MAAALAAGYPIELWTLPGIGIVITRQFGVEYSLEKYHLPAYYIASAYIVKMSAMPLKESNSC